MLNNTVVREESQEAPPITPDLLAKLKKEDMKQAVVERFRMRTEASPERFARRPGVHSPYWRPADDEC